MGNKEEIFKKHFELVSGKKADDMVVSHMKYVQDAMQEYSDQQNKQLLARVDELEKANEWISVDIEPEFGGEYNVVYDLEDGEHPLVTTMEYDKKDNTWKDTLGAGNITNSVLLWRELPEVPKFNNNPKIKILGVSPTNLDEFERLAYGQCVHGENMVNCEKCTQVKQIADNWKPVK